MSEIEIHVFQENDREELCELFGRAAKILVAAPADRVMLASSEIG